MQLWIAQADSGSIILQTLKHGKRRLISGINSLYIVANYGANGEKSWKLNTPDVRPTSGFADVPTAGLLEKNTPVGNYSHWNCVEPR